tara:strand:+ start:206 stop:391 length:186 start_codon:yes stop_codon:yes gene_type:complete
MTLNDKFKQELATGKPLLKIEFIHRSRVYSAPIWSLEAGMYHLTSHPIGNPHAAVMKYLNG